MDINNDTNVDVKVKVAGGGAGIAPHGRPLEDENFTDWPSLPPGGFLKHSAKPPGPWTVCFVVNGRRVLGQARSDSNRVRLVPEGKAYRVEIE